MAFRLSQSLLLVLWAVTFSGSNAAPNSMGTSRTWKDIIGAVVQGDGSRLFKPTEIDMTSGDDKLSDPVVSESITAGKVASASGSFWGKHVYDSTESVAFQLDETFYGFPSGVEHWILETWVPPITPRSFESRGPLHYKCLSQEWVALMMRYMDHHDFYGWSGIDEKYIDSLHHSAAPHPDEAVWIDAVSGRAVGREEAAHTIKWVGKDVLSVIHSKFPANQYQILFNRAPVSSKPINVPHRIDILVAPKVPRSKL